jgi:hypothetical protein
MRQVVLRSTEVGETEKKMKKIVRFVYFLRQPDHRTIGRTEATANIEMTTAPWICRWEANGTLRVLCVPHGYVWDGASVPRPAWSIIGLTPWGLTDGPSLAHDPLYRSMGGRKDFAGCTLLDADEQPIKITRLEADQVFLEACKYAGINHTRANLAYNIVRAFGRKHWGGPCPTTGRTASWK